MSPGAHVSARKVVALLSGLWFCVFSLLDLQRAASDRERG
jgi:hypothetical protein